MTGVRVETAAGVGTLSLDRAELGNSLDIATARQLSDSVDQLSADRDVRCVLIRAEGRMFSVGGDIRGFAAAGRGARAHVEELAGTMHRAMLALARMEKPIVTLVHGPAAGAGFSLALAGDIVLAAPVAHFTAGYGAIGLSPDCGLTWLLPRLVGLRRAKDIILTNRRVGAEEAASIGLVTRLSGQLESEGRAVARQLADSATRALGKTRRLLNDSSGNSFEAQLQAELDAIAEASAGDEGREGIAAFLERRSPAFRRP